MIAEEFWETANYELNPDNIKDPRPWSYPVAMVFGTFEYSPSAEVSWQTMLGILVARATRVAPLRLKVLSAPDHPAPGYYEYNTDLASVTRQDNGLYVARNVEVLTNPRGRPDVLELGISLDGRAQSYAGEYPLETQVLLAHHRYGFR